MYDSLPTPGRVFATEKDIDNVLFSNDLENVDEVLRDSILNAQRIDDHKAYYHLSLKKAALPFYRLIGEGYSIQNAMDAMQVYPNLGEFLERHLKDAQERKPHMADVFRGELSEIVVYGISARDYTYSSTRAPIPSRAVDDRAGIAGTDFILKPVHQKHIPEEWVQVKTFLTDDIDYHPYVSVVGLNQLDPKYFKRQWHEESLAQCMIRELAGEASMEDINKIDQATLTFYQILDEYQELRSAGLYTPEIRSSLRGARQKEGHAYTSASEDFQDHPK